MPNWYILIDNQPVGPYSDATLREQIADGNLLPHDMIWREGMPGWQPAGSFPGLFPHHPNIPPAPAGPSFPPIASTHHFAGFFKRLGAFLIDQILLGIALSIFLNAIGHPLRDPWHFEPIPNSLSILAGWLYYALLESSPRQATLGKSLFGILVTDLHGNRLSFARATGRHFAKILSSLTLGIGYLLAAFTARKQALHDIIASALVVNRR